MIGGRLQSMGSGGVWVGGGGGGKEGYGEPKRVRVAKFDPKVRSRRTTKIKNLVVLFIILAVLILLPYYICGTSSHTAVFVGKRKIT